MMNSSSPRLLRKLRLSSALASVFAYATLAPVQAQILPEVSVGGDGGATIVRNVGAGTMNVDVNGGSRIVTYDTFSLAPTTVLTFTNTGLQQATSVLNRVVAGGPASQIDGTILSASNIAVWLVNGAGITFGPSGKFSGGSLVLSTFDLKGAQPLADAAYLAGITPTTVAGTSTAGILLSANSSIISSGSVIAIGQQLAANGTLDADKSLSTGLRQGSLPGLRLFSERVAPLLAASDAGEDFAIMNLLREASPLVKTKALAESENPADPLRAPRAAVTALLELRRSNPDLTFLDVLQCVAEHYLFEVPASLVPFLEQNAPATDTDDVAQAEDEADEEDADGESPVIKGLEAWRAFLSQPYRQIVPFAEYVADQGPYGTHQGVKGLEFERVLVIMDDTDAKGFLFSYEKLFGTKPLSDTDLKRAAAGEETGADRTRRLLYVTATRAEKSLALVGYTDDPEGLAIAVVNKGWFAADEVEVIV